MICCHLGVVLGVGQEFETFSPMPAIFHRRTHKYTWAHLIGGGPREKSLGIFERAPPYIWVVVLFSASEVDRSPAGGCKVSTNFILPAVGAAVQH